MSIIDNLKAELIWYVIKDMDFADYSNRINNFRRDYILGAELNALDREYKRRKDAIYDKYNNIKGGDK